MTEQTPRYDGNVFATAADLEQAGFTLYDVAANSGRERWTSDPAGLIAHRFADNMVFGYELDGADKVEADQELFDYLVERIGASS